MASTAAPDSPSRSNFSADDDVIEKKSGIELENPLHNDDDDDEKAGEGSVKPAESGDSVAEAVRVESAEPEVEESKKAVVDESLPLDNEFDKAEESVRLDKKEETLGEGVVEGVHVDLVEPGVAVVGEAEGSEVEAMAVEKAVESFPVDDNKFDNIASDDSEDLVQSDEVSLRGGVESESDAVVDAVRVEVAEPGLAIVGEVEESGIEAMAVEKAVESFPVDDNKFDNIASDDSEDLVESDEVSLRGGGVESDSVVDAVRVELAEPVGEVEGSKEEKVDESFPVDDNKLESIARDDEDSVSVSLPEMAETAEKGGTELDSVVDDDVREELAEPGLAAVGEVEGSKEEAEFEETVESFLADNKLDKVAGDGEDLVELGTGTDDDGKIEISGVGNEGSEVNGNAAEVAGVEANVLVGDQTVVVDRSVPVVDHLEDDDQASKESGKAVEALTESDAGQVTEFDNVEDEGEEKTRSFDESESDEETDGKVFGSSEAAKQFLKELKQASASAGEKSFQDGQIVTDSDEEEEEEEEGEDTDEEGEGKELFDSAALAALLKAASGGGTSSEGDHTVTVTSQDGSQRLFSLERPAGLGSSLGAMRPRPTPNRASLFGGTPFSREEPSDDSLSEEQKKKLENMQQMMIKYLRLVFRLGYSPDESIVSQVLYRMALVAGKKSGQIFNVDSAKGAALQLETERKDDDVSFSLNILVLGKSGVGKSSTVNAIFGEEKSGIDAFRPATRSVHEVSGVVDGIKIRVIDSPGLKSSGSEQGTNRRILTSIKRYMKTCPPDIVLYVDRLDTQTRDLNDLPLLKSIAAHLGSSIWRNAIVTLTHAASAPPEGPSGAPLSYDVFVAQRSHVLQQSIGQAVGDLRLMNPSLMNPVSLVENHSSCRRNRDGEKVLPNGQSWRLQLLLLCSSMKILSEATAMREPAQDAFDPRKLFGGGRARSPPLPYMLSWLLQSRPHPKLPADESSIDEDIELADFSDSDQEDEEDEYDQLPPFKPLRKFQLAKLSKEQKKAYLEEYDYRVKLLQKKQLKEELRRMKEIKKTGKNAAAAASLEEEYAADPENGEPAAVQVPLPDMVLPPSFDSDNPVYRYRFLEPSSQLLVRPVLDTHGWDHDPGYDGVNVENSLAIAGRYPAALTVQVTKDKKDFNLHLDSSVAAKHGGENNSGSTMAGFDIQNVGKQLAYIVRGETKFKNFKKNRTAAGVSVTFLGQNVATGMKLEDQISLGKRVVLVGSTGTVRSQGDSAYGANLEVRLREADFPIGQDQSSLGLSLVKWRGDLALAANLQSQFSVGRSSKIAVRAGLNNKLSGQISVRTSSSDQLQIAMVGILPIVMSIYKSIRPPAADEIYSAY